MKRSGVLIIMVAVVGLVGAISYTGNQQGNEEVQSSSGHQDAGMESVPSNNANSTASTEPVTTDKVTIKEFDFQPKTISVKKGTTVTWTNQDVAKHDVMPNDGSFDFQPSELLAKGESYSWTFNAVGAYDYHCSPHPYMKATVVVTE